MISVIPNTWFYALATYFKAQSIVFPTTVICAVMIVANLILNLAVVYGYGIDFILYNVNGTHWDGLGFIGSPITTATTQLTQFIVYVLYMFYYKRYHIINGTWTPFKRETFSWTRIKMFLEVALPQSIGIAVNILQWNIINSVLVFCVYCVIVWRMVVSDHYIIHSKTCQCRRGSFFIDVYYDYDRPLLEFRCVVIGDSESGQFFRRK